MRLRAVFVAGVLAAALLLSGVGTASAQSPCAPGQPPDRPPGQPPGPGAAPGQPPGRPPQYPPGHCQLALSQSAGAAGASVTAQGHAFAAGSKVSLAMGTASLGTAITDGDGSFSAAFVVPDLPEGAHQVTATGVAPGGEAHQLTAAFAVTEAGAAPAETQRGTGFLPVTGESILGASALGVLLVAIGSVAVAGARRRHRSRVTVGS